MIHPEVEKHIPAIRDICREFGVAHLEILGSAVTDEFDPHTAARDSDLHHIVAVRHRLAHEYDDDIDDTEIWTIIREFVPTLRTEVERLLEDAESAYRGDT